MIQAEPDGSQQAGLTISLTWSMLRLVSAHRATTPNALEFRSDGSIGLRAPQEAALIWRVCFVWTQAFTPCESDLCHAELTRVANGPH